MIHIDDGRRGYALVGSSNFTVNGLGLGDTPNIELNLVVDGDRDRQDLLAWFDELWTDDGLTEDVKDEVLRALEALYAHTSPEFVYFKTLLHIFGDYLAEQAEDAAKFEQTAFAQTAICRPCLTSSATVFARSCPSWSGIAAASSRIAWAWGRHTPRSA